MKLLISTLFVALTALPATAFERMLRSDCQVAFEKLDTLLSLAGDDYDQDAVARRSQSIRVTPQGWCQIRGGDQGWEDLDVDTLEWRAEGITRWTRDGIPPLAIELRLTGLEPDGMQNSAATNRPPVSVYALLRQIPDAGQVIVERAVMENDAGDSLAVSGVFERMFMSSPSMMQVSVGAARFKAGLFSLTLEGTHENPFGFNAEAEIHGEQHTQSEVAFDLISSLPDGFINDESRAELTAFSGDLPNPVGTLEVSVASERGLGIMQVAMSLASGALTIMDENGPDNATEILFDGMTLGANWTPAAQVAD